MGTAQPWARRPGHRQEARFRPITSCQVEETRRWDQHIQLRSCEREVKWWQRTRSEHSLPPEGTGTTVSRNDNSLGLPDVFLNWVYDAKGRISKSSFTRKYALSMMISSMERQPWIKIKKHMSELRNTEGINHKAKWDQDHSFMRKFFSKFQIEEREPLQESGGLGNCFRNSKGSGHHKYKWVHIYGT